MHSIGRKLKSCNGSSLLITLVYFMLMFFVGGVVLTAATANGGRIKNLKTNWQSYYLQRSAAEELKNQLTSPTATPIKFEISQITDVSRKTVVNGGATTVTETKAYSWVANANGLTGLQNMLCHAVTSCYLNHVVDQTILDTSKVTLTGFIKDGVPITTVDQLFDEDGNMTFEIKTDDGTKTYTVTAEYDTQYKDSSSFGTIIFRISDTTSNDNKVTVYITGSVSISNRTSNVTSVASGNTKTEGRTLTQKYIISWSEPQIVKGGTK